VASLGIVLLRHITALQERDICAAQLSALAIAIKLIVDVPVVSTVQECIKFSSCCFQKANSIQSKVEKVITTKDFCLFCPVL